ncbi:MAG: hypothetical protein ACLUO4_07980 [Christensenellales bacterium]
MASANDAAIIQAEKLFGSEEVMQNERAGQELAQQTNLQTAWGFRMTR